MSAFDPAIGEPQANEPARVEFCPQNLASFDGWDDRGANARTYRDLAQDSRKRLIRAVADQVNLYSLPTKYFVLDERNSKLLYLAEVKREVFRGESTIRQLQVWRDSAPVTKGISEEVFFSHLAPSADLVISDDQQSPAGKRFWQLRVAEAYAQGLPVFLIDLTAGTKTHVATADDLNALAPNSKRLAIGKR
jgi:hypothetical protein